MKEGVDEKLVPIYIQPHDAVLKRFKIKAKVLLKEEVEKIDKVKRESYKDMFKVGTSIEWFLYLPEEKSSILLTLLSQIQGNQEDVIKVPEVLEAITVYFKINTSLNDSLYGYLKSTRTASLPMRKIEDFGNISLVISSVSSQGMDYVLATQKLAALLAFYTNVGLDAVGPLMYCVSMNYVKNQKKSKEISFVLDGNQYRFDLGVVSNFIIKSGNQKMSLKKYYVEYIKRETKKADISALPGYYKGTTGIWRLGFLDKAVAEPERIKILNAHIAIKLARGWNEFSKWAILKHYQECEFKGKDVEKQLTDYDNWKDATKPAQKKTLKTLASVKNMLMKKVTEKLQEPTFIDKIMEPLGSKLTESIVTEYLKLDDNTNENDDKPPSKTKKKLRDF
jgi:hypothetical protein